MGYLFDYLAIKTSDIFQAIDIFNIHMSEGAKGCVHFQEYKKARGLQSYRVIYRYLVRPLSVNAEARKLKVG